MMTAVEETGGGVFLSELVTGVTTRQCPLQMMTAVEETGGGVSLSELVTGITTRQCPLQRMTSVQETGRGVSLSEMLSVGHLTHHTLWGVRWGTPLQHTPVSLGVMDIALDGSDISGVGHV